MDLKPTLSFDVTVTGAELRLLGLALAGKLTSSRDRAAAAALGVRLMDLRHRHLAEALAVAAGALDGARAVAASTPPPCPACDGPLRVATVGGAPTYCDTCARDQP